jgi:hypothetical protein
MRPGLKAGFGPAVVPNPTRRRRLERANLPSGVSSRLKKQGSLYRPSGPEGIRDTTFRAFRAVGA